MNDGSWKRVDRKRERRKTGGRMKGRSERKEGLMYSRKERTKRKIRRGEGQLDETQ